MEVFVSGYYCLVCKKYIEFKFCRVCGSEAREDIFSTDKKGKSEDDDEREELEKERSRSMSMSKSFEEEMEKYRERYEEIYNPSKTNNVCVENNYSNINEYSKEEIERILIKEIKRIMKEKKLMSYTEKNIQKVFEILKTYLKEVGYKKEVDEKHLMKMIHKEFFNERLRLIRETAEKSNKKSNGFGFGR